MYILVYARTSKAKERGGEAKEAALTTKPPSWYLRRIVWYSNHRKLRGLQNESPASIRILSFSGRDMIVATIQTLAEMQGFLHSGSEAQRLCDRLLTDWSKVRILPVPPNTYQDHKSKSSTHYPLLPTAPWAFLLQAADIIFRCHVAIRV